MMNITLKVRICLSVVTYFGDNASTVEKKTVVRLEHV